MSALGTTDAENLIHALNKLLASSTGNIFKATPKPKKEPKHKKGGNDNQPIIIGGGESSDSNSDSYSEPIKIGAEDSNDMARISTTLSNMQSSVGNNDIHMPVTGGEASVIGGEAFVIGGDAFVIGGDSIVIGGDSIVIGGEEIVIGGEPMTIGAGESECDSIPHEHSDSGAE
jgi:hypothetical protein